MVALENPNVAVAANRVLRELGVQIREVMEELVYDPDFHAFLLAALDTLLAQPKALASPYKPCSLREPAFMPYSVSQRSSQSEGTSRNFGEVCSTSRKTLRPTFLAGSTLAFSSELKRLWARTLCFRKSTVAQGARWDPSTHRNNKSLAEASEHVKPEIERLLSKSYVRRWPSWEAIRLRWPRAMATKLACIAKTKRDGSAKIRLVIDLPRSGVNGLAHVPQKVILPRVKDFAISIVDSLRRPTSQKCQAWTWAASTSLLPSIPSQFARRKRVTRLSRSTAVGTPTTSSRSALPPVPSCGCAFQQLSLVWVSQ